MDEDRYHKEASFHDQAFASDLRNPTLRYYSAMRSRKAFFLDYIQSHCAGRAILEYGCGPYTNAPSLLARGAKSVLGIDISSVAIRQYLDKVQQQRLPHTYGCVMNAEWLALGDSSFDLITGRAILHHLELETCLREISRVLRPGGEAIFIEPLGHNPFIRLFRTLTPSLRTPDEHPLLAKDFDLMRRYFGHIELKYFNLLSLAATPLSGTGVFSKVFDALDRVDQSLFQHLPAIRKHAWTVAIILSEPRVGAQTETGALHAKG